jgi:dTDP-4-amino-4,6-dideoxygalactose transaminase
VSDTDLPFLDLKAQHAEIAGEIADAIGRVVESQRFVFGPEVESLEREIAAYCEAPHAVSCASGSDAILLALMAHGVGPGDEVICPAYTFFATAGCIARLGAVPVFADIDPDTFNVSAESVERAARGRGRLKAILPVHLYGQAAPMDELLALAGSLDLPVVEDAAQSIGARDDRGQRVGSRSRAGCFSFYPSKNLGAYGDGGMVTAGDPELATQLRVLRDHGAQPRHRHAVVGLNSRLDALQAAILRVKLRRLDAWNAARGRRAALYDELFRKAGAAVGSGGFDEPKLPLRVPACASQPSLHVFNQYVIRVPAKLRDVLRDHLAQQHIGSEVYYPVPLHQQECFRGAAPPAGELPHAERAAGETLALPIYPELADAAQQRVVETIQGFLRRG